MDPYDEVRLRNEVIFLHALWQQGPPPRRANHLHYSGQQAPFWAAPPQHRHHQPTPSNSLATARLLHHPSNPTRFKNKRNKIKRKGKKEKKHAQLLSQSPGKEWSCNPSSGTEPPTSGGGWNSGWPKVNSEPQLLTPEEKVKLAANRAQAKALSLTKEYLLISSDDESDDDFDKMEGDDDECEEYRFFVKLFAEDKELNEFYINNYRNGEFVCLVCGGLGKKLAGKKYKGGVALVQHSISIANTNNRIAHRAFGQAICKVLGWEINNLSKIVSAMAQEQPPNDADRADTGTTETEGDAQADVAEGDNDNLAALESKECSVNASNKVEGEELAIIDEGTKDGFTALECKEDEGSVDITDACPEELCDKKCNAEENVGEATENDSTNLESKKAPVDPCNGPNGSVLPTNESCGGGNSEISGESTLCQQNSGSGGKPVGDSDQGVAAAEDCTEDNLYNHLEPLVDGCLVVNDASKIQECPP